MCAQEMFAGRAPVVALPRQVTQVKDRKLPEGWQPQIRDGHKGLRTGGPSLTTEMSMLEPLPRGPASVLQPHRLTPFFPTEEENPRKHRVQCARLCTPARAGHAAEMWGLESGAECGDRSTEGCSWSRDGWGLQSAQGSSYSFSTRGQTRVQGRLRGQSR